LRPASQTLNAATDAVPACCRGRGILIQPLKPASPDAVDDRAVREKVFSPDGVGVVSYRDEFDAEV
jgi:hypothetical protein